MVRDGLQCIARRSAAALHPTHAQKQAATRIETVANIFERLPVCFWLSETLLSLAITTRCYASQGMQCVENYLCLYSMDSTNPQAAAEALQQATYAAQLAALERCIHSLRINM